MRNSFLILAFCMLSCRAFTQADTAVTAYIDYGPEYVRGDILLRQDLLRYVSVDFPHGILAVELSFVVNKDGTVRDPLIRSDVPDQLRAELMASILKLKAFTPAKKNGKPVNYRQVLMLSPP